MGRQVQKAPRVMGSRRLWSSLGPPLVWLVAALCVWPGAAAAQEALTWEQCVQEAAEHNPDLAVARASVRLAGYQHRGSYSNFFPALSMDADYSGARLQHDQANVGLSLTQNLFAGFRDQGQVRRTLAQLDAVGADQHAVTAQVSFDLKSAFARLLYTQQLVDLAEAIAARRKGNVDMVELRFEAGREHKGSFLRSRAASVQADFEVAQAKRARAVAQRELARVLGRERADELRVAGGFDVAAPAAVPDFTELAKQTPAYLEPAAQLRAADAAVTVARASFYPDISATGSVFQVGRTTPFNDSAWSAGIFLSLPLFTGGSRYYDLQSARADYQRQQDIARSANDQAVLELAQAFAAFQDSVEGVGVRQEFLHAAEVRAEIARSLYTSGLQTFDDWDLIENDLISAQKELLASLRDRLVSEASWEQVQGKGAIP